MSSYEGGARPVGRHGRLPDGGTPVAGSGASRAACPGNGASGAGSGSARPVGGALRPESEASRPGNHGSRPQGEASPPQNHRPRPESEAARAEREAARPQNEAARTQSEVARAESEVARAESEVARAESEVARAEGEVARAEGGAFGRASRRGAAPRAEVSPSEAGRGDGGWEGLARRSLWASGVKSLAIVAGVTAGMVRFLLGRDWPPAAMVAACTAAALVIVAAVVAYDVLRLRTTRWRLTPERLELRSGITVRQHRSIPRDRVRSVDLRADPVNRMFGLTVVKAGRGEHADKDAELKLDPLTRHDAEALRRVLLHQGEAAEQAGDGPLAELSWSWIRYAPLSVWTFTGAAVVLGALYKALDAFGLKSFTTRLATGLWEWLVGQPLVTVPLVLGVNLVVGVLGAVLLFAESWGRYRLEREPGRLRMRRGLLTTRSLTLEERRLRGVEIHEPLLLRLAGAARLRSVATGLGKSAGDETEDAAALTPPMPHALAVRVATTIAGAGVPALVTHPAAARRRRLVRAMVATLITTLVVGLVTWPITWPITAPATGEGPWPLVSGWVNTWVGGWVWLLPAAVLVYGLWLAVASAASLGHALSPRHLVSRRGAVVRRTVALDRKGIAGWTITESFFQRRSGLLTVSATTAAGRGHYEVVDVGRGDGLEMAAQAVPGLLEPFLVREKQ
ncbi:PH domain-containing protein [Nonomuraea sp. PA05]|uniref:PH domain-containing protein n=1 Tax=Nonomuraea sp. PA05 TaxID=2604466 RepID=UPI0011D495C7|nr:PH domain-containing protein [Nonomuraea sp. PA05]TYB61089.1 PH domain-containing protein [Nonomuraea sp. PA05]